MSDMHVRWDWDPEKFSPPFTIRYEKGLEQDDDDTAADGPGVVSVMAVAPQIPHQGGKWFVCSAYNVPEGQRRSTAASLKAVCEMKWHEHETVNQSTNRSSNHEL